MEESEDKKRLFELQLANFQSIGKTQKLFLTALVSYLALVWGWYTFGSGNEVSVQVLGVSVKASGFWPVTPLVLTFLCLGLIGAVNAIGPVWSRLAATAKSFEAEFYDLDLNKNFVDYLTFLRIHPEKAVARPDATVRFNIQHFYYPILVVGSIYTTYFSMAKLPPTYFYTVYCCICLGFQALFSVRIFWRAICRFLGVRLRHLEP